MRIVIIGGVAAGMSAAAKAKRINKNADIIVYERTEVVSWGACGLPYFLGDFFTDPEVMIARTKEEFKENGIEVNIKHEVLNIDVNNKTLKVVDLNTGKEFQDNFDRLMIATGASPVIPPIENVNLENVFTLKEFEDGIAIKEQLKKEEVKNVVIIGAGYIGIEAAEAMKKLGKNCRLIQLDARVLPDSFDKEITDIMEEALINHGVDLHLKEMVKQLEGEGKVREVVTDKGSYSADLVIICTGVRPNTAFLKDVGFEMLRNGALIIDNYGETNIKDIYAAGDCASVYHLVRKDNIYIPLATTANKIGRIVGENLAGKKNYFQGTLGSGAIKVMDLEAARTGISENEAIKNNIPYKTIFIEEKNQTSYYPGQCDLYIKLIYDPNTKVILGGQIIGKDDAVLRVDVIATAIFNNMTTEQLGMLDLCYAPPFARTWDAVNVAGNVAK
ncbi:CoA-disulfide reductase [Clostridium tunisiense]|uniref:CoA-disulfide reductase n=1 Tax=Clostridium tunisiense TaxID=219748 RepID=UPI0002EA31FB|nr:CoA-disulfide reductase [Clostridium tunisiense]